MQRGALAAGWSLSLAASFAVGWLASQQSNPQLAWIPPPQQGTQKEPVAGSALSHRVATALTHNDHMRRHSELAAALEKLQPENLPDVLTTYEELLPGTGACELRPFLYAWSRFDAPAAFARARGWSPQPKRAIGMEAAAYGWARLDPYAAREAVESALGGRNSDEPLLENLVDGWAHSGAPGLVNYLMDLPRGRLREWLTSVALGSYQRISGSDAILRLAELVPDDAPQRFKWTIFRRAAGMVANRNPRAAAVWVEAHAHADYAEQGLAVVAQEWVTSSPMDAFAWLEAQGAGRRRENAVRSAFSHWSRRDAAAAEAWLLEATRSTFHDPAVDALARRLSRQGEPWEAVRWAERILDDELRVESLATIGPNWFRDDPEEAEAWLERADLPEEVRQAVRAAGH